MLLDGTQLLLPKTLSHWASRGTVSYPISEDGEEESRSSWPTPNPHATNYPTMYTMRSAHLM
jgi:hypothetical protein